MNADERQGNKVSVLGESKIEMLTENGLDIPMATFQSRKIEEDAYGEFELLTERPNFGNELAVLLKCPIRQVKACDVHATF